MSGALDTLLSLSTTGLNKGHRIPIPTALQTAGSYPSRAFVSTSPSLRSVSEAWAVIGLLQNTEQAKQASAALHTVESFIALLPSSGIDPAQVPMLRPSISADGSLRLEWSTEQFRAGISIDLVPTDSSWYVVSTRSLGEISASGSLSDANRNDVLPLLLDVVVGNT